MVTNERPLDRLKAEVNGGRFKDLYGHNALISRTVEYNMQGRNLYHEA